MRTKVIYPFLLADLVWVFDGSSIETHILGFGDVIERLAAFCRISNPERGFSLLLSDKQCHCDARMRLLTQQELAARADLLDTEAHDTYWYEGSVGGEQIIDHIFSSAFQGWGQPPQELFIRVEPLPAGTG